MLDFMKTLASYRNRHRGETIVVCGCGESLNDLPRPERFVTIGVNDVGRRFDPTYLVVLNPRHQFSRERFHYVETSRARAVFTQLELGVDHPNLVRFKLGTREGTDLSDPDSLPYTQNSPYVALCLAAYMGAVRIGLIGVDFTDHHFFAKTGRHVLTGNLAVIDREYRKLGERLAESGIRIYNLSRRSNVTAFPKMDVAEFDTEFGDKPRLGKFAEKRQTKIFFVNYKFLFCGDVFGTGLRHAATDLSISSAEAYWDDPDLPEKIRKFDPDLVLVVHGREFFRKWGLKLKDRNTAVWLLDEPYEVDDTIRFSSAFDHVFVNDPGTRPLHRNAHYLPVCYDPHVHYPAPGQKKYTVGFIGAYNPARQNLLGKLSSERLLDYVVGGPWSSGQLENVCIAGRLAPREVADLYRQTRIVLNIFRDRHPYNAGEISGYSLNPRIYEALACGALVLSEYRPEISKLFPELPTFRHGPELEAVVRTLIDDDARRQTLRRACRSRLQNHTYADRLAKILAVVEKSSAQANSAEASIGGTMVKGTAMQSHPMDSVSDEWVDHGKVTRRMENGDVVMRKTPNDDPATECGLASEKCFSDVELAFDVKISANACFIAKIHQVDQLDQATNSYHLYCHPGRTYVAMHNRVFRHVVVGRNQWQRIVMRRRADLTEVEINGTRAAYFRDGRLKQGYCFLGIKGGEVALRNISLLAPQHATMKPAPRRIEEDALPENLPSHDVLHTGGKNSAPSVTIVTTVYDRLNCLKECLRSVADLNYKDFEHIIISDHPPAMMSDAIMRLVETAGHPETIYANLRRRFNNWGIAPASVGVYLARGRYICFLSDDNGFTPDHLDPLVAALDRDHHIGFAYSSCRYAGPRLLRNAPPCPGGIDLGQPLFRKTLFEQYLSNTLPFNMMAWDWYMIESFLRQGVKWRHIDRPSFLFRLDACRQWSRI